MTETEHMPDYSRIPASLQSLDWKPYEPGMEHYDGQKLLVAVAVLNDRNTHKGNWKYEIHTIVIDCDETYFRVNNLDREIWGWELDFIDYFVEIK